MDNRHDADSCATAEWQASLETHDRVLRRAHAARAQLLRNALYNCAHKLRVRICAGAEKLHINFCPLCCQ